MLAIKSERIVRSGPRCVKAYGALRAGVIYSRLWVQCCFFRLQISNRYCEAIEHWPIHHVACHLAKVVNSVIDLFALLAHCLFSLAYAGGSATGLSATDAYGNDIGR